MDYIDAFKLDHLQPAELKLFQTSARFTLMECRQNGFKSSMLSTNGLQPKISEVQPDSH